MKNYKNKWALLLSDKRHSDIGPSIEPDGFNPFENDYGRLIISNKVSSHLYSIISVNFRQNYEQETYPNDRYNRIRMVIDFLTSLNDSDAISLYQELKGLKI